MVKGKMIPAYAIAGAIGAMCYLEPLHTRDADFLVEFPTDRLDVLTPIFEFLKSRGYNEGSVDGYVNVGGWPIPNNDSILFEGG
jgi:hypothetical protein